MQGYDYARAGAYFVTICVQDRACLLGEVAEGDMHLSQAGRLVEAGWLDLPRRFPGIDVDAFVIMPNHVDGIVVLGTDPENGVQGVTPPGGEGAINRAPTETIVRHQAAVDGDIGHQSTASRDGTRGVGARFIAPSPPTPTPRFSTRSTGHVGRGSDLGEVIRAVKAVTSRHIRLASTPVFSWQRNYYERIIRDHRELDRARAYIAANPARWSEDAENPVRTP